MDQGITRLSDDFFRSGNLKKYSVARGAYGGEVLARTLSVVQLTIPGGFSPEGLHAYFIRPVKEGITDFHVERLQDGATVAVRFVRVTQQGTLVFSLMAAYHKELSVPHPLFHEMDMPTVPQPESLKSIDDMEVDILQKHQEQISSEESVQKIKRILAYLGSGFDMRPATEDDVMAMVQHYIRWLPIQASRKPCLRVWCKNKNIEYADQSFALLALFLSDAINGPVALKPHPGVQFDFGVSLDHAMWFHGPFDPTDWLLVDCESPVFRDGRVLIHGRLWTRDGRLVASYARDMLFRVRPALTLDTAKM